MSTITVRGYSRAAGLHKIEKGQGYGVWYEAGWSSWHYDWREAMNYRHVFGGGDSEDGALLVPEEML